MYLWKSATLHRQSGAWPEVLSTLFLKYHSHYSSTVTEVFERRKLTAVALFSGTPIYTVPTLQRCHSRAQYRRYSTKTLFQLPPITILYMPSDVMLKFRKYSTLPLQCLHQDCIPSQDGFHSLPGWGPRPYARRPKRTNRRPTVRLPSAFGPHKYPHLLSHS